MRIGLIVLSFFIAASAAGQTTSGKIGKTDCLLKVQGVDRHFIVYQPSAFQSGPLPVVFMFHGTSGNGEKFYNISGWKEKADEAGLIAVFPSALRYCIEEDGTVKNTTKWNEGKLERTACKGQNVKDDVLFFREMVRYLVNHYPVDPRRIYASGFSNGGNFVSRLTLEASDVLAATSIFAGFLQDTSFQAVSLIPSYLAIGDLNIRKNTGKTPEWSESAINTPGLNERVMSMVDELKLEKSWQFAESDSLLTWRFGKSRVNSDNEFRFSLLRDLEHRYPNGKNHPMIAADLFWDFYSRFSK